MNPVTPCQEGKSLFDEDRFLITIPQQAEPRGFLE